LHTRRAKRVAKTHRTYTVAEAAELYDVHRNTVLNWHKNGLQPIESKRPLLFHGTALNGFHAERRARVKRKCAPGELYCVGCREPVRPAGGLFDAKPLTHSTWKVTGICKKCGCLISQRVNRSRLSAFEEFAAALEAGSATTK
jgi:hypothetical protein